MRGMRVYFNSLVTPGLGAAGHIRRFSKRFIKDDLPTFGYPTTPARTCQNIVKVHTQKISKKNRNTTDNGTVTTHSMSPS